MKVILLNLMILLGCITKPQTGINYLDLFNDNPSYKSTGFNYPVGPPNGKGYYNAQKFTENTHLGDDWNGTGGGNTDLGDPVYAIANGYISQAYDTGGGWGNVVRVVHLIESQDSSYLIESLYAHLDTITVEAGSWIKKGAQIGTIGNANGQYYAHLHLEIRTTINLPLGGGYSSDTTGYTNPTRFIEAHR